MRSCTSHRCLNQRFQRLRPASLKRARDNTPAHANVEYRLSIFNRFILAAIGSVFITPAHFHSSARRLCANGGWRFAHSTEDMEMALRMQHEGHLIANAPRYHIPDAAHASGAFPPARAVDLRLVAQRGGYRHMIGNGKYGNLGYSSCPPRLSPSRRHLLFSTHRLERAHFASREICATIFRPVSHASFDLFISIQA